MVATHFSSIEPQEDAWTLAGALSKIEFLRDVAAAETDVVPGARSVTRRSLVDLLERPPADDEFEQNDPTPGGKGSEFLGLDGAAAIAATMLRTGSPPQSGNTGGRNSQSLPEPSEKGDDCLLPPREYLVRPAPKNFVELAKAHWTESDPDLFAKLPQGGGGIDWLCASIFGELNERGIALVKALKHCKLFMGKKDGAAAGCAEAGLHLETHKYRDHMVFSHPFLHNKALHLSFGVAGKGRSYQPLIVRCEGLCITFGRIDNSEGPSGTRGPVATVEITGSTFLQLGETAAFKLASEIVASLGIVVSNMRCSRLDVCVDLPGATVDSFVRQYMANNKTQRAGKSKPDIRLNPKTLLCEYFAICSSSVMLRIYDKVQECIDKDPSGHRMELMEQNRWGGPQQAAVRVEFQFRMGKNRSKKYESFRALFEGMSDLIGWATNEWFRLCTVGHDRSHAARYKGVDSMCDEWLRVLHAFAFWSGRLDRRHKPPAVQTRPCQHLINGAIGTFAAALGRAGIVPVDDVTAFGIMAAWKGPNALAEKCREVAIEHMATKGVVMRNVSLRSTEDEPQFLAQRRILDAQLSSQSGPDRGEQIPF